MQTLQLFAVARYYYALLFGVVPVLHSSVVVALAVVPAVAVPVGRAAYAVAVAPVAAAFVAVAVFADPFANVAAAVLVAAAPLVVAESVAAAVFADPAEGVVAVLVVAAPLAAAGAFGPVVPLASAVGRPTPFVPFPVGPVVAEHYVAAVVGGSVFPVQHFAVALPFAGSADPSGNVVAAIGYCGNCYPVVPVHGYCCWSFPVATWSGPFRRQDW